MEFLMELLSRIDGCTPNTLKVISSLIVPFSYPAGHIIFAENEPYRRVYYIEEGLVKGFFLEDTTLQLSFIIDKGFILPVRALAKRGDRDENLHFMTETNGWCLNIARARALCIKNLEMLTMMSHLIVEADKAVVNRQMMHKLESTEERFLYFRKHHKTLVNKIPDEDLAALLGVCEGELTLVRDRYVMD